MHDLGCTVIVLMINGLLEVPQIQVRVAEYNNVRSQLNAINQKQNLLFLCTRNSLQQDLEYGSTGRKDGSIADSCWAELPGIMKLIGDDCGDDSFCGGGSPICGAPAFSSTYD